MEWVKTKYPFQVGPQANDETLIPGYKAAVENYHSIRTKLEGKLEDLRKINQMMSGAIVSPVQDLPALREVIGDQANLADRADILGAHLCVKAIKGLRNLVFRK